MEKNNAKPQEQVNDKKIKTMKSLLLEIGLLIAVAFLLVIVFGNPKRSEKNDTYLSKWDYQPLHMEKPRKWVLLDGEPGVMLYDMKTGEVCDLVDSLVAIDSNSTISIRKGIVYVVK